MKAFFRCSIFLACVALSFLASEARASTIACLGPTFVGIYQPTSSYACPAPTAVPSGYTAGFDAHTFEDRIGVNVHLFPYSNYADEPYDRDTTLAMGIHHVRDVMSAIPGNPTFQANAADFCSHGIKFDLIVNANTTAAQIESYASLLPSGCIESLEGPNEYNNSGDPSWWTTDAAEMQQIALAVKTYANLQGVRIYGPTVSQSNYAPLGDLTPYEHYGAFHPYPGGYFPETTGFGSLNYCSSTARSYGSITYNWCNAQQASTQRAIVTTETGYCSATYTIQRMPDDTKAAYLVRLLMDNYKQGIPYLILYELISEKSNDYFSGADCDHTYGLIRYDGSQPPDVSAMAGFMGILSDAGTTSVPCNVPVTFGAPSPSTYAVETFAVCKSTGEMDIAYWLPAMDYSPNALVYVTPPDESVSASWAPGFTPTSWYGWSLDRTGVWTSTASPNLATLTASVLPKIIAINGTTPTPFPALPTAPPTPTPTATPTSPPPTPTPAPTATPTTLTIVQVCGNTIPSTGFLAFPITCGSAPAYGDWLLNAFTLSWYQAPRDVILPPQTGGWAAQTATISYDAVPTVNGVNDYAHAFNTEGMAVQSKYVTDQSGEPNPQNWLVGSGNQSSGISYDIQGVDSSAPVAVATSSTGKFGPGTVTATCPSVTAPRIGSIAINIVSGFAGSVHNAGASTGFALNPPTNVTSGWTSDIVEEPSGFTTFGFHRTAATTTTNQVISAMSATIATNAGTTNSSGFNPWICQTFVVQHP